MLKENRLKNYWSPERWDRFLNCLADANSPYNIYGGDLLLNGCSDQCPLCRIYGIRKWNSEENWTSSCLFCWEESGREGGFPGTVWCSHIKRWDKTDALIERLYKAGVFTEGKD
jgi:hypothetical protein